MYFTLKKVKFGIIQNTCRIRINFNFAVEMAGITISSKDYGTSKHPQHDVKICVPFECPDTINVVFL